MLCHSNLSQHTVLDDKSTLHQGSFWSLGRWFIGLIYGRFETLFLDEDGFIDGEVRVEVPNEESFGRSMVLSYMTFRIIILMFHQIPRWVEYGSKSNASTQSDFTP